MRRYCPLLLAIMCLTATCGRHERVRPAIRDFRQDLRPALISVLGTGMAMLRDSAWTFIYDHATDEELEKLTWSEHPILRAAALDMMISRPGFDHQQVILQHLDDTAIVLTDYGEFGGRLRTVSDAMLENARWKTAGDRQKIVDEVILHHNMLRSAYTGLSHVDAPAKYYSSLKEMALRHRPYEELQYAVCKLAYCGKKEDIATIRDVMLQNMPYLTDMSFEVIKDFPDPAYMEILLNYYPRKFYRKICEDPWGAYGFNGAVAYLKALVSYRIDASAEILEKMIERRPFVACKADTVALKDTLMRTILENPCFAYVRLRRRAKQYLDRHPDRGSSIIVYQDSTTTKTRDEKPAFVGWF